MSFTESFLGTSLEDIFVALLLLTLY